MMHRGLRLAGALVLGLTLSALAPSARAQFGYVYPGGYGGWGWGGWGGSTVFGDAARGMGMFAAGVGQYNVNTAQAMSINTDTVMRYNQYLWEAQRQRDIDAAVKSAQRRQANIEARNAIYTRLRDQPNQGDINSGDALNVAFNQITAPGVYSAGMKEAQTPIPSSLIKDIPFNKASEGITVSLNELTNPEKWPEEMKVPALARERDDFRAAAQQVRKEDDEGDISPESYQKLVATGKVFRDKLYALYPENTPARHKITPFVKGIGGLIRMLDQPQLRELLRNVDETPDRTLSDLLNFMVAFNLRFGVAETPRERLVYAQLYPLLDSLRDKVARPEEGMPVASNTRDASDVTEFFGKMDDSNLHEPKPIPSVPTHRTAPAPPKPANP